MFRTLTAMLAFALIADATLQAQAAKLQSISGMVKAVSDSSLSAAAGRHDVAFVISRATRSVGKGLASDLVLRDPPRNSVADSVKPGDRVTVTYRISGGAMHARARSRA